MDNDKLYTVGEFAKKAGVTIRTIRFYDKKGLLKPTQYNSSGYRLYSEKEFFRLQKILTLKFLGFSLYEIYEEIEKEDEKNNFTQSLNLQKKFIQDKIEHMKLVVKAIDEAQKMNKPSEGLEWDKIISIIQVINMEKEIVEQYKNSSKLSIRISMHEKYSVNKYGWHRWIFDKLKFINGVKILELGCGNADLWVKNLDRIPEKCEIVLSDISKGMINDAKERLSIVKDKFVYKVLDAQNIPFENESFDIVIANHMLFYVKDVEQVFKEIRRVLKNGGVLYASTIGMKHMEELKQLAKGFDSRIKFSTVDLTEEFGLENGKDQLMPFFDQIGRFIYDDSLIVDESEPIIDYIMSTHGNVQEILADRKNDFIDYVEKILDKDKEIYITKNSGIFEARKL